MTYLGLRSDDTVVVLISVKDQGMTSAEAVAAQRQPGVYHIPTLGWVVELQGMPGTRPGTDTQPVPLGAVVAADL